MSKRNSLGLREVARPDPQTGETMALSPIPGRSAGGEKKVLGMAFALVALAVFLAGYVWPSIADSKIAAAKAELTKASTQEQLRREKVLQEKLEAAKAELSKTADAAKATAAEATTTASNALIVANEAMGKADQARGGIAGLQRGLATLQEEVRTNKAESDREWASLVATVDGKVSRTNLVAEVNAAMDARLAAAEARMQRRMLEDQVRVNKLYESQQARLVELSKRTAPKYR